MATNDYLSGRKKYQRPQALLFSENPGIVDQGYFLPSGFEAGSEIVSGVPENLLNNFIILSDDNRDNLDFKSIRIEKRERMINGRMRSYHIADKKSISVSWSMLPSRAFSTSPEFKLATGVSDKFISGSPTLEDVSYTTDGGAGGSEILNWYEDHKGSFWVFLAYDNPTNFPNDAEKYNHLSQYNEVVEMFITDFSYAVVKRGGSNYDFWNISITLEEV